MNADQGFRAIRKALYALRDAEAVAMDKWRRKNPELAAALSPQNDRKVEGRG